MQYALPAAVAQANQAVVVAEEGERLYLAVSQPEKPGLAALLATATGRPVHLIAAGADEIALALADHDQPQQAEMLRRERLHKLVTELGLDYLLDEEVEALLMSADSGPQNTAAAIAARLPDGWGPELLGLVEGLPHLDMTTARFSPALRVLLPPAFRTMDDGPLIAPWRVEGGALILACETMPREDLLASITAWTGWSVRCVLCAPHLLRQAALPVPSPSPPAGVHRMRLLRRTVRIRQVGVVAATLAAALKTKNHVANADQRHLRTLARQTGVSPQAAAQRLQSGGLSRRSSVRLLRPQPKALALLPAPLARSLAVLPLRLGRGSLELALSADRTDGEEIAAAIAILTGRVVRLRPVALPALRAAQARAYPVMLGSGASAEASRATPGAGRPTAPAGDHTVEPPAMLAALLGIPFLRLQHYAVSLDIAGIIPLARLQELRAVPLRRENQVLWVALAEPDHSTLRELARLTALTIRPLLANPMAITQCLDGLAAAFADEQATRQHGHPVIKHLRARGLLTQTDLFSMLADPARAVDEALDNAGVLSYLEFADVAARLSGLPLLDLQLQPRQEDVVDALGRPTRRTVWDDPVEPAVASLLTPETARAFGVLPVRRGPLPREHDDGPADEEALLIAVADPFSPANDAALTALTGERPQLGVAPRPLILTAQARARGQAPLGERLLAQGIITVDELTQALRLHRTAGVRLGQALLSLNLVSQEQLASFLAEQKDLAYFALHDMNPATALARLLPEEVERRLGVVPLYDTGQRLVAATPDPLNQAMIDELATRTGREIEVVVCTEADLEAMLEVLYRDDNLQRSTSELVVRTPEESASRVLTRNQGIVLALTALAGMLLLWRLPAAEGIAATGLCTLFYIVFSLYRCYLIYRALSHGLEVPISPEELANLHDATLPIYTILVPLYKEASVLPTLLLGLSRLDYPATKLDVKLLLEEDDVETLSAVEATALPSYVHPVIVPTAQPRGKPKACNYGLIRARGEYVVIYDAEDVPDPDQLKKVVLAFRKVSPAVACLQAKLNYYNGHQNLLTSWFTTEYSMWFDLFLPGLDASGVPVPLGGTSNHFPTARLREAGAWDPYNVTEDADLGIRLFRRGWKTAVIDSTTYEEANSEVYNWIRQRSRWVKGYIQTYLVHMRHPVQLWRAIGFKAFFSFTMVVGGTFFSFLLNPIFWCLTTLWYLSHAGLIRAIYPAPVFYLGTISLFIGNVAFIYLNIAGCLRRGHYDKVKYALLSPLYWALMSLAAWKGFLQLWTNPFYWEKTTHGLYRRSTQPTEVSAVREENNEAGQQGVA